MIRKHIDYSDLNFYEIDIVEENKTVFNFIKIKTKKQASQQDKKHDKMSK